MTHLKFNLSGHQNQDLANLGFIFPGAIHCNLADDDVAQKVATFISTLNIGSGDTITIAAPGLSALTLMVCATIHGLTGSFPFLQLLVRQQDGSFVPGSIVDLQSLRNNVARGGHRSDIVVL